MITYTLAIYLTACSGITSGPPKCVVQREQESIAGYRSLAACKRAGRALDAEMHGVSLRYNYVCMARDARTGKLQQPAQSQVVAQDVLPSYQ